MDASPPSYVSMLLIWQPSASAPGLCDLEVAMAISMHFHLETSAIGLICQECAQTHAVKRTTFSMYNSYLSTTALTLRGGKAERATYHDGCQPQKVGAQLVRRRRIKHTPLCLWRVYSATFFFYFFISCCWYRQNSHFSSLRSDGSAWCKRKETLRQTDRQTLKRTLDLNQIIRWANVKAVRAIHLMTLICTGVSHLFITELKNNS